MTARLAILADIHANVWALDAVLKHAKQRGLDAFVNLGDTLYGPLKPHATYERLLHENVLATIQGNQAGVTGAAEKRRQAGEDHHPAAGAQNKFNQVHKSGLIENAANDARGSALAFVVPPSASVRQA